MNVKGEKENVGEENKSEINENKDLEENIEYLKKKVAQIEEEDEKIRKMNEQLENAQDLNVNQEEIDARSIYVGGVDYSVTPEELQQHFHSCGTINRVTILCDKWSGHPKGYAYIEFAEKDSVANAVHLNESILKGRQLKVLEKRTNIPGMSERGRGRFRASFYYGYRPYFAPRGRFRSRRAYYRPYG
jgi:polyadenylate-binding protein 2